MCYDSQGDSCFEASGGTVDVFKWVRKGDQARLHKEREEQAQQKL